MSAKLDVVTGYLGSGKTTFIEKYIKYLGDSGITFTVIENEFGRAGVDADILRSTGAEVLEISGGCVCCTLKVTLYDMLADLAERADRIILEPSGLFCGDDLIDIVNTPSLDIVPGFWLGIVDPCMNSRLTGEESEVLMSELIYAGAVYISKTDICGDSEIQYAEKRVNELFGDDLPAFFTEENLNYPELLRTTYTVRPHERKQFDHASMYKSASVSTKRLFGTEKELSEVLDEIYSGGCGEVLRIKGSVLSENGGWSVNCSVGSVRIEPVSRVSVPVLNIIGKNISRKQISTILNGLKQ